MESNIKEQIKKALSTAFQQAQSNQQSAFHLIETYQNNQLQQLVEVLLEIILTHSSPSYRQYCARELQTCLFNEQSSDDSQFIDVLTTPQQKKVLLSLAQILGKEQNVQVSRIVSDALQKASVAYLPYRNKIYSDFDSSLQRLLTEQINEDNMALRLGFATMVKSCPTYFKRMDHNTLYAFFESILNHSNPEIKLSALHSFSSYVQELSDDEDRLFISLCPLVFKTVYFLVEQHCCKKSIQIFLAMIEPRKLFYKKSLMHQIQLISKIFYSIHTQSPDRYRFIDIIGKYILESQTEFMSLKRNLIKIMIEMILFYMVNIQENISEKWISDQQQNFVPQNDQDIKITKFGMFYIDKLFEKIKKDVFFTLLKSVCKQLLDKRDWRCRYSALMAFSQIGSYVHETQISSILSTILLYKADQNPKVRFAMCHAIGLITIKMKNSINNLYGQTLVNNFLSMLINDSAPVVVCHAISGLVHILQSMKQDEMSCTIYLIMNLFLHYLQNGTYKQRKNVLTVICSVVEVSKNKFHPYIQRTVEVIFALFYTGQFDTLQQSAIKTINYIYKYTNIDDFQPFLTRFLQLLLNVNSKWHEHTDSAKICILNAWSDIVQAYESKLGQYLLDREGLFDFMKRLIQEQISSFHLQTNQQTGRYRETNQKQKEKYKIEEAKFEMIYFFIESFLDFFKPFTSQIAGQLMSILKSNCRKKIQKKIISSLILLVNSIQDINFDMYLAKDIINEIVENQDELKYEKINLLKSLIYLLRQILQKIKISFLTEDEICKLIKLSINSIQIEHEQAEGSEFFNKLHYIYTGVIEVVFKNHKTLLISQVSQIAGVIVPSLIKNENGNGIYLGLVFISELINNYDYEVFSDYLKDFSIVLLANLQNKRWNLRQVASYGLRLLAEKVPSSQINQQTALYWLTSLKYSLSIPRGFQKLYSYKQCEDNIISAMGLVIKYHSIYLDSTNYLKIWMNKLPLLNDLDQAKIQHELFMDLVIEQPQIFAKNVQFASKDRILIIIGGFIDNKELFNEATAHKINRYFENMKAGSKEYHIFVKIWRRLDLKSKKNLAQFMK